MHLEQYEPQASIEQFGLDVRRWYSDWRRWLR